MLPQLNNFISTIPNLVGQKPKQATAVAPPDPFGMIQQLLGNQQQQGLSPEMLKALMRPDHVDTVGDHNRGSNLPSGAAGTTNPWASGFFKPMEEAFPELKQKPDPILGFANPSSPQNRGETIAGPTPWASSFKPNSGDVLNGQGQAIGRTAADRYGSGHATFGSPQVPAGPRLAANDPALMTAPQPVNPFAGVQASAQPGQQPVNPWAAALFAASANPQPGFRF